MVSRIQAAEFFRVLILPWSLPVTRSIGQRTTRTSVYKNIDERPVFRGLDDPYASGLRERQVIINQDTMLVSSRGFYCPEWRRIVLFVVFVSAFFYEVNTTNPTMPDTVPIGALIAFDSTIGRVAKQAINLALDDINRNSSLLNGTKLTLQIVDTNCSAFQGAAAAMELLKKEVVAVAGPQTSLVSHFVALMGGATQVPLISFAATDPSLSEHQYPYFFRIAHSDVVQMAAVAAVIGHYGWREVIALYTDDDYGTNGLSALGDALGNVGGKIIKKVAIVPGIEKTTIHSILKQLTMLESRIFVVHMQQDVGLMLLSEAYNLSMMQTGYVWILTDSVAATLESVLLNSNAVYSMQGIIGTRSYVPDSPVFQSFSGKWQELDTGAGRLNVYGLYAYDAMWMIAYAIDDYLKQGGRLDFENPVALPSNSGGSSELAQLKIFKGGSLLREQILKTRFNGTSGPIQVDAKGDLVGSSFEIVNVRGKDVRVVGYWTNETGISVAPPNGGLSLSTTAQQSLDVSWPGGGTQTPRGWVLPKNGRSLIIAVPNKVGYEQFARWSGNSSNSGTFSGYCIDVFEHALKYLPYAVPYKYVPYGNATSPPIYDDMIEELAHKMFDAVVGDVTITTKRMEIVDFTQPFIESGLVVVVPVRDDHSNNAWAFLRPFTPAMWCITGAFFIFTGIVIWMLEHKENQDFRGRPKKQIVTILWFIFSTLFFAQREKTKSTLGRIVTIIWLFVVLIITSSYTANLTSILTVQQLSPTIQGLSSLQTSDVPVGYQTGSFARDYLIGLSIAKERLKNFSSIASYATALKLGPRGGGVAAIVDELPYVQMFLGTECGFTIAGQEFTRGGWGFAFPRDSPLTSDLSAAILNLSESGELQRLHDKWLAVDLCNANGSQGQSNQLSLTSFWGLFLVTGLASAVCLIIYTVRLLWQFTRKFGTSALPERERSLSSKSARFIRSFASYVDEPSRRGDKSGKRKNEKKRVAQRPDQSPGGENLREMDVPD